MSRFVFFILLLFGLIACKPSAYCNQSDDCIIEDADYNFGVIPDSVAILNHRFQIFNNTSDSCRIIRIEKSCGCTQVRLTDRIIPPESSSFLDVEIDLGANYNFFERDINIYTNLRQEPYTIFLRATREMPLKVIQQEFPVKISKDLRANIPFIILGNVSIGDSKSGYINLLNSSDHKIDLSAEIPNAPSYVSVFYEDEIEPKEIGRLVVTVDLSEIQNYWGLQRFNVIIKSAGNSKTIPVEAIFVEKFNRKDSSPRILIPVSTYTIDSSSNQEVRFFIKNVGNDTLFIRDLQISDNACNITLKSNQIPPNYQNSLIVRVGKNLTKGIDLGLTTNDPTEPYKILRILPKHNE